MVLAILALLTNQVRIRCAHPSCFEYDLCVNCFSNAKYSDAHQPATHPYRVIEQNSVPIYESTWGADEELLLIEGAEMFGLGSWADIANHIGGYRSKEEVADHYTKVYLESDKFVLPERADPNDMALLEENPRDEFQVRKKRRIEERKDEARSAPPSTPKKKPTASVPSCHEVQGYMPGRLEFETEHFNDAEEAVMHMQFDPGEGINPRTGELEPEMELKMTIMDIYNARLVARTDRKKVIFEHNLLDYKLLNGLDKKRTKEERDLLNKAKPFARMQSREDMETFDRDLVKEQDLRAAIAQLQEWRRMCVPDLKNGERYEQEKVTRAQKQQPMGSLDREKFASQRKQAAIPEVPRGAAALVAPELPLRLQHGLLTNGIGSGNGTPNGVSSPAKINGTSTPIKKKDVAATLSIPPISGINPLTSLSSNAIKQSSGRSSDHEVDTPWADSHLLTPQEVDLCKVMRMHPKPYLALKHQILAEALKGDGKLRKRAVKEIWAKGLDGGRGGRIWEAFVNWGWIAKGGPS